MKRIDWDMLIRTCPWRFCGVHDKSVAYCSAQPKSCRSENCAVFYFVEYVNRPLFVPYEVTDEKES